MVDTSKQSLAAALLALVLCSAYPASCMPTLIPPVYSPYNPSSRQDPYEDLWNRLQAQEGPFTEQVAENEQLGAGGWDASRNSNPPSWWEDDFSDLEDDDLGEQPNANALAEDLQSVLTAGSQPVARTQLWSSIRKFLGDHFAPKCSDALYIMAFTSGDKNAFTRNPPIVELLVGDEAKGVVLPELPGETFIANKGDLWRINFSEFGFTDRCVTKRDVEQVTLVETGTDGWHIDSVVTFLKSGDSFTLLSSDMDAFRWVDGNQGETIKRFSLSIV